ncbi:DUF3383 family protein [Sessilibacter corallicola]|uniref:DUF3383 family protein n=1 Tax=Sessilibacter corallicola TaxID=2904075 RepID=UPI001E3034A9|nr:DUF3383 family protein [Sessilibacter corallicola]MCE2029291.1 DUF3383 domain-containing protein [Sessilibacter corallicola]
MSVSVDQLIPVTTRINPAGIGFANFGSATMFSPSGESPSGVSPGDRRVYSSLSESGADYATGTQTYQALNRWFGNIPRGRQVTVYTYDQDEANIADVLNEARDKFYWYWTFFTASVYSNGAMVGDISDWHLANDSFFINCQTGDAAAAIRDINTTTDMASEFTSQGFRRTHTFTHATDPYAGIALAPWFASVNYSAAASTITGEYKKLTGVQEESLSSSAVKAMKAKKVGFYGVVDLQGQTDNGRVINSITHSSFDEYIDSVVDLDAYINAKKVRLYNTIANQPNKLPQTISGQQLLISESELIGEQYIANGYLGERQYTDIDTGLQRFTRGYEILTQPEDILSIPNEDRRDRLAAPMRELVFPAGAIHGVNLTMDIF